MGEPVYPLTIKARNFDTYEEIDGKRIFREIEIFYPNKYFPSNIKKIDSYYMLFTFKDIQENFELVLNNWFNKNELLKPVYDLYFSTIYNPFTYLNHKFLSLVQALEAYHRKMYGGNYLSDEQYNRITSKIKSVIDEELTGEINNTFKQKLAYLNEYSLRKRLKNILEIHEETTNLFIGNKRDFVNDVVNTRNYLTHFDNKLTEHAKNGRELYQLTLGLQQILNICLLYELGIPKEQIAEIVKRNHKFSISQKY